jgi:hypothetical protein
MPADRDAYCWTLAPTKRLAHFFWHLGDVHGRRSRDAIMSNQSLFTSASQVKRLWGIPVPPLKHPPPVEPYSRGSWGHASVDTVIAPHRWHLPRRIEVAPRHLARVERRTATMVAAAHLGRPEMLSVIDETVGAPGPHQVVVTTQAIRGRLSHGCRP